MTNIDVDIALRNSGKKVTLNVRNNILTELGIDQAKAFAHKTKENNIDVIVCSPLARTKQTAYTIASVWANLVPIHYDRAFREIEWDIGGKFDRIENYIPDFDSKNLAVSERILIDHRRGVKTLESQEDVYNRVVPRFVTIAKRYRKKNSLIVAHFFVLRAILAFMEEGTPEAMLNYSPKNLEDIRYEWEEVEERINRTGLVGGK